MSNGLASLFSDRKQRFENRHEEPDTQDTKVTITDYFS
jgi:hypothetical protein